MPQPNPFPLNVTNKINSPQLLAWLAQFGDDKFTRAEDFNQIFAALVYLYENMGVVGASQLADLTDVELLSLADDQYLVWDSVDSKWKNKTVANATDILKNNYAPNTLTASAIATETIIDNYDLGVGFLGVGESLNLYAEIVKNFAVSGASSSYFYLSKVSNSISVTDAVKIATSNGLSSGGGSVACQRTFHRKSTSILSGRIAGGTASITDVASINNIPVNIINDANLSNYRYLIVTSIYNGTSSPNNMQTNILLTKNTVA